MDVAKVFDIEFEQDDDNAVAIYIDATSGRPHIMSFNMFKPLTESNGTIIYDGTIDIDEYIYQQDVVECNIDKDIYIVTSSAKEDDDKLRLLHEISSKIHGYKILPSTDI